MDGGDGEDIGPGLGREGPSVRLNEGRLGGSNGGGANESHIGFLV